MSHNVDGASSNAQVDINTAINEAASGSDKVVHMNAGTFVINEPIVMKSGVTLEGAGSGSTIVRLAAGLSWAGGQNVNRRDRKSMIQIDGSSNSNITIKDFSIDGNYDAYYGIVTTDTYHMGQNYFNNIRLNSVATLRIYNLKIYDCWNDGILINECSNTEIYNIIIDQCGHDGFVVAECSGVTVHNCTVYNRSNSSIRIYSSDNTEVYNCDFSTGSQGSGWGGVEIQYGAKGAKIHNNFIHDIRGPGVFTVKAGDGGANGVAIYNNIFKNCATALDGYAIRMAAGNANYPNDVNIYSNIFDRNNNQGAIQVVDGKATVKDCIFTNNKSGISGSAAFTISGCDFYNTGTSLTGTGSKNCDPKYTNASANNYALTSGGCMDVALGGQIIGTGGTAGGGGSSGGSVDPIEEEEPPVTPPVTPPADPPADDIITEVEMRFLVVVIDGVKVNDNDGVV